MGLVGLGGLDPAQQAGALGVGQQQLVEIAASLVRQADVLILDEPTAALTETETDLLFQQIARLKAQGTGIIYISHRLEELQRVANRISVLRDGQLVATHETREVSLPQIVREMVGRELGTAFSRRDAVGTVALRVVNLQAGARVRDVSFEVRRGEILGFAGLMGSGRTEVLRAIFGADRKEAGALYLGDADVPTIIQSPGDAVRHGLAFITEDRKQQGLLLTQPIRANITLARMREVGGRSGLLNRAAENAISTRFIKSLQVRCASPEQTVAQLSGGNQQKVVIAKWLYRDSDILLCDEPTRGIDVGAKFEIYALLADLAAAGKAIIVVSSELEELMALCDRIAVMSVGKLVTTFQRGEWSQDQIMNAALSQHISK